MHAIRVFDCHAARAALGFAMVSRTFLAPDAPFEQGQSGLWVGLPRDVEFGHDVDVVLVPIRAPRVGGADGHRSMCLGAPHAPRELAIIPVNPTTQHLVSFSPLAL